MTSQGLTEPLIIIIIIIILFIQLNCNGWKVNDARSQQESTGNRIKTIST